MNRPFTNRHLSLKWVATLAQPILVVGNGVLSKPVPEKDYASIVRINNFQLGGMSGERITHWVVSGYKNIEHRAFFNCLIPWSSHFQNRRIRYDFSFGERMGVKVVYTDNNDHITQWFPAALMRWKSFPSVGFCFLAWLNKKGIKPDIIGFDGMKTGHQDDPAHRHTHTRTRGREWAVIQSDFIRQNIGA